MSESLLDHHKAQCLGGLLLIDFIVMYVRSKGGTLTESDIEILAKWKRYFRERRVPFMVLQDGRQVVMWKAWVAGDITGRERKMTRGQIVKLMRERVAFDERPDIITCRPFPGAV